jgi:hypothetical protein
MLTAACNFGQSDLCTWQRVLAHGNIEYDTLFPFSYILLILGLDISWKLSPKWRFGRYSVVGLLLRGYGIDVAATDELASNF